MSKYGSAIEKIVVSEATFQNSPEREIEPSWINFFYGNNGSGKTTISRMIRNGQGLTFGNAAQADEFATVVFNRDFIDEELKFDIMPGVVMLSKEASDKQQEIEGKQKEQEQLKGQLQAANDEADAIQKKRDKLKASLDAAIWKAAAKYKKIFGGKGDLSSTARCVQRVCSTAPVERNFDDIKARYESATDPNATRYDAAPLQLLDLTKLESAEKYSLLGQAIISTADNAYSRFWQNLHAMDWVNTGHIHYSENAEGCCPYCKRELPSDFEEQFLACFDEKYSQDCTRLLIGSPREGYWAHLDIPAYSRVHPAIMLDQVLSHPNHFGRWYFGHHRLDLSEGPLRCQWKQAALEDTRTGTVRLLTAEEHETASLAEILTKNRK